MPRRRAVRVVAVARDDAGDVRAVAVVVVRLPTGNSTKSTNCDDARGAEIVVPVGDAGIDDRDADAGAVEPEGFMDPVRADGRAGALHRPVTGRSRRMGVTPGRLASASSAPLV